jgi:hypothetical protein
MILLATSVWLIDHFDCLWAKVVFTLLPWALLVFLFVRGRPLNILLACLVCASASGATITNLPIQRIYTLDGQMFPPIPYEDIQWTNNGTDANPSFSNLDAICSFTYSGDPTVSEDLTGKGLIAWDGVTPLVGWWLNTVTNFTDGNGAQWCVESSTNGGQSWQQEFFYVEGYEAGQVVDPNDPTGGTILPMWFSNNLYSANNVLLGSITGCCWDTNTDPANWGYSGEAAMTTLDQSLWKGFYADFSARQKWFRLSQVIASPGPMLGGHHSIPPGSIITHFPKAYEEIPKPDGVAWLMPVVVVLVILFCIWLGIWIVLTILKWIQRKPKNPDDP